MGTWNTATIVKLLPFTYYRNIQYNKIKLEQSNHKKIEIDQSNRLNLTLWPLTTSPPLPPRPPFVDPPLDVCSIPTISYMGQNGRVCKIGSGRSISGQTMFQLFQFHCNIVNTIHLTISRQLTSGFGLEKSQKSNIWPEANRISLKYSQEAWSYGKPLHLTRYRILSSGSSLSVDAPPLPRLLVTDIHTVTGATDRGTRKWNGFANKVQKRSGE